MKQGMGVLFYDHEFYYVIEIIAIFDKDSPPDRNQEN